MFYLTIEKVAIAMAPAASIAPGNYFAVVLAGFWGWLLWGQVLDMWSVVGSVMVIMGGLLTVYQARHV